MIRAPVRRDARDGRPHLPIERVELREIGRGVRLVDGLAGGVGGDQRVADVGDVELRVGDALPGMRVDVRRGHGHGRAPRRFERLHALRRLDDEGLGAGRLDQPAHPAFELEPVGDHELGVGEAASIGGRRASRRERRRRARRASRARRGRRRRCARDRRGSRRSRRPWACPAPTPRTRRPQGRAPQAKSTNVAIRRTWYAPA